MLAIYTGICILPICYIKWWVIICMNTCSYVCTIYMCSCVLVYVVCSYVYGFDKAGFHAHNSKIRFSPWHNSCTHQQANKSHRYYYWKLTRLLLLWLVSEACQTFTSVPVVFNGCIFFEEAGSWLCIIQLTGEVLLFVGHFQFWHYFCQPFHRPYITILPSLYNWLWYWLYQWPS